MKKIIAILVVLIIAYTAFWFYEAEKAKETFAKHLKEAEKPGENGFYLNYEDLSVGGYPFSYIVKVKNPKILQTEVNDEKNRPFSWLNGSFDFGTNLWGSEYWVTKFGEAHLHVPASSESPEAHIVAKGESTVSFNIHNSHPLKAMIEPFKELPEAFFKADKNPEELFNLIREGEVESKDLTISIVDSNSHQEEVFKADKTFFEWEHEHEKEDNVREISWKISLDGMTANYKNLMNFANKFNPTPLPIIGNSPYDVKTDFILEGKAKFPKESKSEEHDFSPLFVQISKFDVKSKLADWRSKGTLDINPEKNGETKIHYDHDITYNVTPEGYKASVEQLNSNIKYLEEEGDKVDPSEETFKKLIKCCKDDIVKLLPHLERQGKMQFYTDFDATTISKSGKEESFDIKLHHFDATSDLYGLKADGEAKGYPVLGKFVIKFSNYKSFINDIFAYYNRIRPLLPVLVNENQNFPLWTPQMIEKLDNFLDSFNDEPGKDAKDLHITINFPDQEHITIGKKDMAEASQTVQKFMEDIEKDLKTEPSKEKNNAPVEEEQKSLDKTEKETSTENVKSEEESTEKSPSSEEHKKVSSEKDSAKEETMSEDFLPSLED